MAKVYITFLTLLVAAVSYGQSLERIVFNSTGGPIGNPGSIQMLLSIGEPVTGVSESADFALAAGFLGGSKSIVATTAAITELTDENVAVYPNPFSTTIRIHSDLDNIQVSVYNTIGQEVYSGAYQNKGLNLSTLSPGIYILHATAGDRIITTTKLLKQ